MFKIYDGRSHFYQWDIDRKLIVEDASISEVHFCNQTDNYSLVCKTYIEDGLNLVNVPNILLQNDWRINVYAYDSNYTKFSEQFDVIRRCKPEDYVYTETEILNYNTLSDRITKIEEGGGITPTIGDNGNWYLGSTDTGKPSRGEKGDTGAQGEKGDTGATGADGKSAYSYAQDGGYTGTKEEFAAKLAAEGLDKALFVVNITHNGDGTYSADKTFEEITQAYNEGKYNIVAIMALRTGSHIMPLLAAQKTGAVFGMVLGQTRFSFVITSNNEVQREMIQLATLKNKLPNPYPLTFTGAVSETYDGSSAKTIEIPSGGSGAFTASYTVVEEVTSYTLNIDTSKYSGYAIFIRNSTSKAPSVVINREHKKIGFTGYDANTNFFDINIVHNDSDNLLQGFCKLQKNNNTSAIYCSYGHSDHATGATEENNGIIITAETIGAGSEIFVRCM